MASFLQATGLEPGVASFLQPPAGEQWSQAGRLEPAVVPGRASRAGVQAAEMAGVRAAFPHPGESLTPSVYPTEPWWPERPWETATESPAISTGLPDSVLALIPRFGAGAP